jgi:hypothetical protein
MSALSDVLVSIGLPVRNGADRLEEVVWSVLAQDHERIELVISDNASTDATEQVCRELARADRRIRYHRHPENVGLLNNFRHAMQVANGVFFRWIGDDDWLAPDCVSRGLEVFAADDRLILVTTQVAYTGADGTTRTAPYHGTRLGSDDPVERFVEMLRLLNESYLLIDPLYGLMRREPVAAIPRRNMLHEDEVFAAKLALAGPWGHVPEVLAQRHWRSETPGTLAQRLGVPSWQTRVMNLLQCREMLRWLDQAGLTPPQRRAARAAVGHMYLRRQRRTATHRSRKLVRLAAGLLPPARPLHR